jgi:hypothetical protein
VEKLEEDETAGAVGVELELMKLFMKGLVELIVVAGKSLEGGDVSPNNVSL